MLHYLCKFLQDKESSQNQKLNFSRNDQKDKRYLSMDLLFLVNRIKLYWDKLNKLLLKMIQY